MTGGRKTAAMIAAAFAWAAALVPAALLLPVYSGSSSTSAVDSVTGAVTASTVSTSATLVGQNGSGVVLIVALPAILTVVVAFALRHKRLRGGRVSGNLAAALVGVLAIFSVLGIFTIGLFVVPVVALLACATALTKAPAAA